MDLSTIIPKTNVRVMAKLKSMLEEPILLYINEDTTEIEMATALYYGMLGDGTDDYINKFNELINLIAGTENINYIDNYNANDIIGLLVNFIRRSGRALMILIEAQKTVLLRVINMARLQSERMIKENSKMTLETITNFLNNTENLEKITLKQKN